MSQKATCLSMMTLMTLSLPLKLGLILNSEKLIHLEQVVPTKIHQIEKKKWSTFLMEILSTFNPKLEHRIKTNIAQSSLLSLERI